MKKVVVLLSVFLFLMLFKLEAQIDFQNNYTVSSLICQRELSNQDYILLFANGTITRTNNVGTPLWSKYIAETATPANGANVSLNCIQQTADGGFIITGGYYNTTTLDYDAILIKTDAAGTLIWSKSYGGTGKDCGLWVQQTTDGGYIVSGTKNHSWFSNISIEGDIYVFKTDNTGSVQWERVWSLPSGKTSGQNIKQTSDGGYILTGNTDSEHGATNVYLIKLNSAGNITWQHEYHVTCFAGIVSSGREVWEIPNGYIVGGFAGGENFTPPSEAMFLKVNLNGDVDKISSYQSWTGVPITLDLGFNSIDVTSTGEFIGTGGGYNDGGPLYILKADANLNMVWSRTYGGMASATSVRQTNDGGYALVDGAGALLKTDGQGMINCYTPGVVYSATITATKHNLPLTAEPIGTEKNLALTTPTVTVNTFVACPPILLQINTVSTDILCNGDNNGTATANPITGTAPYTYTWAPGGGNTQTINNLGAGVYTVTVTDNNGATATGTVTVTEPPTVVVNIQGNIIICEGESITLTALANGGTPNYTYVWDNNQTGTSITVTPPTGNNVYYTVIATDNNGCTGTGKLPIIVNTLPQVSFTADKTEGCGPLCINFTNTTGNTQNLEWNFGDGSPISNTNPAEYCYTNPGSYSVNLTVTDGNGCSNTLTQNNFITVYPTPQAAFGATPNPTTILNPTIIFSDSSINTNIWNWTFGDVINAASTLQNPSYTYNDTGNYLVQLIVENEFGCRDTAEKTVRINADYVLYIPNTFTPNGDGINDFFIPQGMGIDITQYHFWVFDRWGNLIFESNSLDLGWNGIANDGNEIAQIDTYVWKVALTDILGEKHQYVGHVNLIK